MLRVFLKSCSTHWTRFKIYSLFQFWLWILVGWTLLYVSRQSEIWKVSLFDEINFITFILGILVTIFWLWKGRRHLKVSYMVLVVSIMGFWISTQFTLVNVDRSRSFYVLSWIDAGEVTSVGGQLDLSKVNSLEKLNSDAIQSRLAEQTQRGYIENQRNNWVLTKKGKSLLMIANWLSNKFKLTGWSSNAL